MAWLESNIPGPLNLEFLYEGGIAPVERTKTTTFSSTPCSLYLCCYSTLPDSEGDEGFGTQGDVLSPASDDQRFG